MSGFFFFNNFSPYFFSMNECMMIFTSYYTWNKNSFIKLILSQFEYKKIKIVTKSPSLNLLV